MTSAIKVSLQTPKEVNQQNETVFNEGTWKSIDFILISFHIYYFSALQCNSI